MGPYRETPPLPMSNAEFKASILGHTVDGCRSDELFWAFVHGKRTREEIEAAIRLAREGHK